MVVKPLIKLRADNQQLTQSLISSGTHPLIARLWAARGIQQPDSYGWGNLLPPVQLTNVVTTAEIIADAISQNQRFLIVADYDCDGATACAVAVRGLRSFGAKVGFLVPNRFITGYGLSPAVVQQACEHSDGKPDILITVDNGIASIDGVQAAKDNNIEVIVTDHHLPGAELPDALAIVNPNQQGCDFPSKNLAGVGVMFYLLLALRAVLRQRGKYPANGGPRLDALADLVALGTVADVVRLDANNRLLVAQGLKKIRQGQACAGLNALFQIAGRNPQNATAQDLGFALGPRINAAGRMSDMSIGINCLLEDDPKQALELAGKLNEINNERRTRQTAMSQQAMANIQAEAQSASVCVWQNDWHTGIIGLVASQLKETYWRPAIAFAPDENSHLRGSGRSIPQVHLRDVLDLVNKRLPGAMPKFGGHSMAAGLSLKPDAYDDFVQHFDQAVRTISGESSFEPSLAVDGSLTMDYFDLATADLLSQQVWGAGFPEPMFQDEFRVLHQQLLKDSHLKLFLERDGIRVNAIWFNHKQYLPDYIKAVYQLNKNSWNGKDSLQLIIEHADAST